MDKFIPKTALEGSGYADPRDGSTNTTSRSTGGQETQFSAPNIPEDPEDSKKKEKKYMTVTPPKKEVVEVEKKKMAKYVKAMNCYRCGDEYWQGDEGLCSQCVEIMAAEDPRRYPYYKKPTEEDIKNLGKRKQDLIDSLSSGKEEEIMSAEELEQMFKNSRKEEKKVQACIDLVEGKVHNVKTARLWKELTKSLKKVVGLKKTAQTEDDEMEEWFSTFEQPEQQPQESEWTHDQEKYYEMQAVYNEYAKNNPPNQVRLMMEMQFPEEEVNYLFDALGVDEGEGFAQDEEEIKKDYRPTTEEMANDSQKQDDKERIEELAGVPTASEYVKPRPGESPLEKSVDKEVEIPTKPQFSNRQHIQNMMERNQLGESGTYESKPRIKTSEMAAYSQDQKLRQRLRKQNPELAQRMEKYRQKKWNEAGPVGKKLWKEDPDSFWKLVRSKPQDLEAAAQQLSSTGQPYQEMSPEEAKGMPQLKDVKTVPLGSAPPRADQPTMEALPADYNPAKTYQERARERAREQADIGQVERLKDPERALPPEEKDWRDAWTEEVSEQIGTPDMGQIPGTDKLEKEKKEMVDMVDPRAITPETREQKITPEEIAPPKKPLDIELEKTPEGPAVPEAVPEEETELLTPEQVGGMSDQDAYDWIRDMSYDKDGKPVPELDTTGMAYDYEEAEKILSPEAFNAVFKDAFKFAKGDKEGKNKGGKYSTQMINWPEGAKALWDQFMKQWEHTPRENSGVRKKLRQYREVIGKTPLWSALNNLSKRYRSGPGKMRAKPKEGGEEKVNARLKTITKNKLVRGELINGPEWLHRVASDNKYLPVGDYACVLLTNKLIAVRLPDSHKAKKRMEPQEVRELYKAGAPTWAIPR